MPNYNEQIDPQEISSAIGATKVQMNELSRALEQVRSKLDGMTTLMQKQRDYTRDELREMQNFKREVESVANMERKRDADRVKGMSDYSIYMERIEKKLADYKKTALDAEASIKKAREENSKLEQARQGRFSKEKNQMMREELKSNETNGAKLKKQAQDRIEANKRIIQQQEILRNESKKQVNVLDDQYAKSVKIKNVGEEKVKQARGGRGISALEMASDMNIPGVSSAATVAKYARNSMGELPEGAGMLATGAAALPGLALGAGIVGAGYTAMQGYKAYNTAHQMAPAMRTLRGQGTSAGDRRGALDAYGGYGGVENLNYLQTLNRSIGSGAGAGQMRGMTDVANRFGMAREEVAGQAGSLLAAGGTTGGSASQDLQKILIEGVKGGMDRARITQFTQQVVGIQQGIFEATGENNSQGVASQISQMMRAYTGDKGAFFKGPEMAAVRGIDAGIKGASRGQGSGQATLMRAFGFGAGAKGGGFGTDYYDAMKTMEGGLFGKGGKEGIKNLKNVLGQYDKESGGDKKVANLRMQQELGLGLNQSEKLRDLLGKVGGPGGKNAEKEIQKIMDEQKDPMERLLDINAKMDANIAKLASSDKGLAAIIKIDELLLSAQESAVELLEKIANALAGNSASGQGKDVGGLAAGAIGAYAGYKGLKGLGDMVSGAGKAKGKGGLMKQAGGMMRGAATAYGAYAAAQGAGEAYDAWTDQDYYEKLDERTKDYGVMDYAMNPGVGLAKAGSAIGTGIGKAVNWMSGGKDPDEIDAQLKAQGFTIQGDQAKEKRMAAWRESQGQGGGGGGLTDSLFAKKTDEQTTVLRSIDKKLSGASPGARHAPVRGSVGRGN